MYNFCMTVLGATFLRTAIYFKKLPIYEYLVKVQEANKNYKTEDIEKKTPPAGDTVFFRVPKKPWKPLLLSSPRQMTDKS